MQFSLFKLFLFFCAMIAIDLDMTLDHRHKDQTLELVNP